MAARSDTVQVMVRLRPSDNPTKELVLQPDGRSIGVHLSHQPGHGVPGGVNNQLQSWGPFALDGVLDARASQATVYDMVASDVVEHVLQGYNGTIMAYGQTGAGKTYTMNGRSSSFEERGITPRAIGHIFRAIAARPDMSFAVSLSYVEIYNEHLFDLLAVRPPPNARNPSTPLHVDLAIQEDLLGGGGVSVKGLVKRTVNSEQECLDALFAGDTQRSVGEHALNEQSTRSHVIYTIYLEMRSRVESSEKVIHSKLNLVDLAGSERVGKTGTGDKLLQTEAAAINKSLSILEQVVVALSSKQRDHIPHRSSRLTHLLKDSLGGNTRTRLIATLHSDAANLPESTSTLKFAARMRKVSNSIVKNVSMDPQALIVRLQREVRELKSELAMHDTLASRIGISYEPYTPEESVELRRLIAKYCSGAIDELEIVNLRQVREAFRQFKNYVLEVQGQLGPGQTRTLFGASNPGTARGSPEPVIGGGRPGSANESAHMVGDVDDSAGGFGIGIVSAASRPAARPDSRDEPLKPSNIVKSRARAAAAAGGQTTGAGTGRSSLSRGRQASGSAPSGQQLQQFASSAAVKSSPKAATRASFGEEQKSNAQSGVFPALRQATFGSPQQQQSSPSNHTFHVSSPSNNGASAATAEAAAFAAFKAGPGFDAAELVAAAKQEWSARRRELRSASLRVNELKRRIDELAGPLAAKRAERQRAEEASGAEVEVLDESEYELLQASAAAKADYKALYAARLDVEAATLRAEQAVADARQSLFDEFSVWFREQYGIEPSTTVGGTDASAPQANSSPRAAERLQRLGREAKAAAQAAEEAAWQAHLDTLDPESRSFLTATRNLERAKKSRTQTLPQGGRRPYVGAAFK